MSEKKCSHCLMYFIKLMLQNVKQPCLKVKAFIKEYKCSSFDLAFL